MTVATSSWPYQTGPILPPATPLDLTSTSTGNLRQYATETTQRYMLGARMLTWDGKLFKQGKSGAACRTGRGNIFYNAIPATGIDYSLLAANAAVGDRSILMTNQGTVAQTENGLSGGIIVLKVSTADTNVDATLQMRGIVGNTAGGVSDTIRIYLDAPLNQALTAAASYAFCMPSPWSDIRYNDSLSKISHAGIPATYVSATGYYIWVQTYGLCWIAPQSQCGTTAYGREVVFRYDGSIQLRGATAILGLYGQLAGFIVDNNEADNGSTVIMLQVSAH